MSVDLETRIPKTVIYPKDDFLVSSFKILEGEKSLIQLIAKTLNMNISELIRLCLAIGIDLIEKNLHDKEFREILQRTSRTSSILVIRDYLKQKKVI